MPVPLARFAQALRRLQGRTLITYHERGDADAVCSALVLKSLLGKGAEVRSLDKVDAGARHTLQNLRLPEPRPVDAFAYDNLVLVDVSTAPLLGRWLASYLDFPGKRLILDHHAHASYLPADVLCNQTDAASTGELVYLISKLLKRRLTALDAQLLLASILHDTAWLKGADEDTFTAVAELLPRSGQPFDRILHTARTLPSLSERLSVLRAAHHAQFSHLGEHIIAVSTSEDHELASAAGLVALGADVAFVSNPHRWRVSAAKRESLDKLDIGKLMASLSALGGSGGGHRNVGGATLPPARLDEAVSFLVDKAARTLDGKTAKSLRSD